MRTSTYEWMLIIFGWMVVGGVWFFLIRPLTLERREKEARESERNGDDG